ncbi:hypothetical protein BDV93DRAFT_563120 [Ceratobasidium sp. AG-I]|nr:hypothetical protein BDV93DRAFT_563120 [Ceratobasidium sp. AG-I]
MLVPSDDAGKPAYLHSVGMSYRSRFGHLGEPNDIEKAITYQLEAVNLAPETHAQKAEFLYGAGELYLSRYRCLGNLSDVDAAIESMGQAVSRTVKDHVMKPTYLNGLGVSYMRRFERLNDLEDIDKSIEHIQHAVLLTPDNNYNKCVYLNSLGNAHRRRFENLCQLSDIDAAIEHHSRAVLLVPKGHAGRTTLLDSLGKSHLQRFRQHAAFKEAAYSSDGPISARFEAACLWSKACLANGSPQVLIAYKLVMELLPSVVWLGATAQRRYREIAALGDISNEAATVAVGFEAFDLALTWLEQGRSIVWKQVLQLRTPMDELRQLDSYLADQMQQVAFALEKAAEMTHDNLRVLSPRNIELEQITQRRHNLANEWESLLAKVHSIPQFGNFLRPKSFDELIKVAQLGALVFINVYEHICCALVLQPFGTQVGCVPLPEFSLDQARRLVLSLREEGTRNCRVRKPVFDNANPEDESIPESSLAVLWSHVVKPVLDHLGYSPKPVNERPRVTWCTAGLLSFLPLHAAGLYDKNDPETRGFSYVVSSYTLTLSNLIISQDASNDFCGILGIGQASTHSQTSLPGTVLELDRIGEEAVNLPFTRLDGASATTEAVLQAMETHSWVHFACHASQNVLDPMASSFHLHNGVLNLGAIIEKPLKNASFAFLSACQTATGDQKLPDEALHLAAGMITAGYKSVIATMWSIFDDDAPLVAEKVYAHMLEGGRPDHRKASKALHIAMESLRDKVGEKAFAQWVPFIHVGV